MSKWSNTRASRGQSKKFRSLSSLMMVSVLTPLLSVPAFAQGEVAEEEIVVTGTRQVIQDQIAIKRNSVGVVDGLSSSEIGELPALSIGEALESITGVASHRENGGATEVTIRGLGPFLSLTTFNGREATNGSGDRSVNFSQFPSELLNKIAVVKTQSADMIEGGVAGVIALETLKPLEYGKRRFQIDGKLNWNPDSDNVDNTLTDDIGTRIGASYVDQFEFDNGMALGWSVGGQVSEISQPEQEVRSSSPSGTSLFACVNDPTNTDTGFFRSTSGDCEDSVANGGGNGFNNNIDPATGEAFDEGSDFAFTGSTRGYRQNETVDSRDAFFGALQFQPNEQWDLNFDVQWSERDQEEERHDLNFETRRVLIDDGVNVSGPFNIIEDNELQQYVGEGDVLIQGESFSRIEEYLGGGLAVTYSPTDRLTLDLDLSRSRTTREEVQIGNQTNSADRQRLGFTRDGTGNHLFVVENFDVTDPASFYDSDRFRTRVDVENVRENIVEAVRFDLAYDLDFDVIKTIKTGFRVSSLEFLQLGGNQGNGSRLEIDLDPTDGEGDLTGQQILEGCLIDFPESGFLSSAVSGNLVTNVTDVLDPSTTASGTGTNNFVTYDNQCFSDAIFASAGEGFALPSLQYENVGTIDVTEDTTAAYVMADYEFENGLRGNFGFRVVQVDVDAIGFRSVIDIEGEPGDGTIIASISETGDVLRVTEDNSYTEVLPSFQVVYDLNDDMILRGGIFRGISKADPADLGFDRDFDFGSDDVDNFDSVQDVSTAITASSSPLQDAYTSWNGDVSWEWYPDDDTVLAVGLYYKTFKGNLENVTSDETFQIGDELITTGITTPRTGDDESDLYGIEITGSYRWDIGIGVKLSYNHAETNFEFEDSNYGATFDGQGNQLTTAIVEPGSIPGFSEDVFSGQLYYQIGDFDVAAIYKYRSEYFQPFTTNGTRLRYVDGRGLWEARASYKLNDNIKFKVEALNLFSQERRDFFYTEDNFGQLSDYGPRIFVGVTAKF